MPTVRKPLSLRTKLVLSLSAIAAMLLVSTLINVLEYRRMSDTVSRSISNDIACINASGRLADACSEYNLTILADIGEADTVIVTGRQVREARGRCLAVYLDFQAVQLTANTDSLSKAFHRFIQVSDGLEKAIESDFLDVRTWYFTSLQPAYNRFMEAVATYNAAVHDTLMQEADDFQASFYRSIAPGVGAVLAGLLLIGLLLYFILSFYVRPIYRMNAQLEAYNQDRIRKYGVSFDGDDQLSALNAGITELADENSELKHRIRELKNAGKKEEE